MKSTAIPLFTDINDLHVLTGSALRAPNSEFHCFDMSLTNDLKLNETKPHRANFCTLALNVNTEKLKYTLNETDFTDRTNFILCVAPGQIASWEKQGNWYGYCAFFKPEFLNFESPISFLGQFPFFNIQETNLIPTHSDQALELSGYFKRIIHEQDTGNNFNLEIMRSLFQAVLWQVRRIYESSVRSGINHKKKLTIAAQYQYLVNDLFLKHTTVENYAELLNVSPNHLSQTIVEAVGIPAKKIIASRRLSEAKYLLQFSDRTISEISDHLSFSEATHFVKFFKKECGMTPTQFRTGK